MMGDGEAGGGLVVRLAEGDAVARCLAVRRVVFIDEQGVSEADEMDGEDDRCVHVLAEMDGTPVGAARLATPSPRRMKVQRVCVLKSHRGARIGEAIMAFSIEEARRRADQDVVLGAQLTALAFYERLGFEAYGDVFDDAGIAHRMMRLTLV